MYDLVENNSDLEIPDSSEKNYQLMMWKILPAQITKEINYLQVCRRLFIKEQKKGAKWKQEEQVNYCTFISISSRRAKWGGKCNHGVDWQQKDR